MEKSKLRETADTWDGHRPPPTAPVCCSTSFQHRGQASTTGLSTPTHRSIQPVILSELPGNSVAHRGSTMWRLPPFGAQFPRIPPEQSQVLVRGSRIHWSDVSRGRSVDGKTAGAHARAPLRRAFSCTELTSTSSLGLIFRQSPALGLFRAASVHRDAQFLHPPPWIPSLWP